MSEATSLAFGVRIGIVSVAIRFLSKPEDGSRLLQRVGQSTWAGRIQQRVRMFRDDRNDEQFLTFSKTQDIAKTYPWESFPANQRAAAKAEFEKPGLLMLGYKMGIQNGEPVVFDKDKDDVRGNSWVMLTKIKGMRIHFTINWQTLRYRWSVESQKSGTWAVVEGADTFGQCEDRTVHP